MGLSEPILKAIEEMGFETPTEVQSKSIPRILNKEDLIIMSKTGSGKTAVFGISTLMMTTAEAPGPQCLILTPTRELAVQVDRDINQMAKYLDHKTTAVYGQHSMRVEVAALSKGVTVVTGTPGRIYDHIEHRNLNTKHIKFLVLDEADRMLDMGFLKQVIRIIKTLPRDHVTLLFSATIPTEIQRICTNYMKQPVTIEIASETKTVDAIEQSYYRVNRNEKNTQLFRLLQHERPESCIIFCNTRSTVDGVQNFFTKHGIMAKTLHGDIPQSQRTRTIDQFKAGQFRILVATDVAARGIHVDDLSLVINYDLPAEKDSYVHRIGRTGRAGNGGHAVSLVTQDCLMTLYDIEEHVGSIIYETDLPTQKDLDEHIEAINQWLIANQYVASENINDGPRPSERKYNNRNNEQGGSTNGQNGRPPYKPNYHKPNKPHHQTHTHVAHSEGEVK